jgi:hypothetical protein
MFANAFVSTLTKGNMPPMKLIIAEQNVDFALKQEN